MSESDLPLFPEAMVGWRSWRVKNGRLYSVAYKTQVWAVGKELHAECDQSCNRSPGNNCGCGIYAVKSLALLKKSGYFGHEAFGQVSLWGKVMEASEGFRAEFAYPKVIYVTYLNLRMVEPLSVYGVPVKVTNPYSRRIHGNRHTQADH